MSFPYIWNNITHLYYPDFYLPEYNVYLEPKNYYLTHYKNKFGLTGEEKVNLVSQQNNLKVILLNESQLTWKII